MHLSLYATFARPVRSIVLFFALYFICLNERLSIGIISFSSCTSHNTLVSLYKDIQSRSLHMEILTNIKNVIMNTRNTLPLDISNSPSISCF